MRVIFMGTPKFAVSVLQAIVRAGHDVAAVYTRAPKPGGRRGLATLPSPVEVAARAMNLPVHTPTSLKSEAPLFASHHADVAVVVAYGLLLPRAILEIPAHGCLNLHASLLPRWRGAAPIQRAIMAGDKETGVAVMRMEETLDTGPVALVERTAIEPNVTAGELQERLSHIGAGLMVRALAALAKEGLAFTAQPQEGVTYAHKIAKAEAQIDWSRPAFDLHNLVRGLSPHPGAVFETDLGKGSERIKVLRSHIEPGRGDPGRVLDDKLTIACGEQALRLTEVQRAGRAPMKAEDFLRGTRLSAGTMLSKSS